MGCVQDAVQRAQPRRRVNRPGGGTDDPVLARLELVHERGVGLIELGEAAF